MEFNFGVENVYLRIRSSSSINFFKIDYYFFFFLKKKNW